MSEVNVFPGDWIAYRLHTASFSGIFVGACIGVGPKGIILDKNRRPWAYRISKSDVLGVLPSKEIALRLEAALSDIDAMTQTAIKDLRVNRDASQRAMLDGALGRDKP